MVNLLLSLIMPQYTQ